MYGPRGPGGKYCLADDLYLKARSAGATAEQAASSPQVLLALAKMYAPYDREASEFSPEYKNYVYRTIHLARLQTDTPQPRTVASSEGTRPNRLVLRWDAEPPADKLQLLRVTNPRFEQSYRRQRPDLADQSDSAYDFSLAIFALRAHWTFQEAADLLIASRREFSDTRRPGKALRHDYQTRTLTRAQEIVRRRRNEH
jgi:hypothetical protein